MWWSLFCVAWSANCIPPFEELSPRWHARAERLTMACLQRRTLRFQETPPASVSRR
ncbi:hypothetical protein PF005_g19065 [Phytophthora fragariae]|uniref:Uncharacterized protein n=1 Tax=Phytophthora fragariae TaxID=53985 RepID=A0A6A3WX04_9STRA|nr:hypothetical protein PF003_g24458 [Phytophthora fragariae]KAE8930779.1 hypothetical protein PF009_g19140 [Phytophthora fragariae]KAE9074892.1 hypothetical protein PF010_g24506 [Phytophthora fragariae]KAE9077485.1 hypothetical protein PF007_g24229 [Phytophthora fragariae]KAE9098245.1 hypothetical protein PF006_g23396 [Phytophthora fragariae]